MPFIRSTTAILRLFTATAALCLPVLAQAQDAPSLLLELNRSETTETPGCSLTYVATNRSDKAFADIAYEVATFDAEGIVSRIFALEIGAMAAGKTSILRFELPGPTCEEYSRIVVNTVVACTLADGSGEADFCLSGLEINSRAAIQFGL